LEERFKSYSAVFPLVLNNSGTDADAKVLLHRRQNTGYEDGKWDIAGSGHVDKNETAQATLIRECKEEIGIDVKLEGITFVHLSHRLLKHRTYYDIYFLVSAYEGTPRIMEPHKCSELEWFSIHNLPDDVIECRKQDIQNYLRGIHYSEKIEM